MGIKFSNGLTLFLAIFFGLNTVCPVNGGETCTSFEDGRYVQEYCDYGCCGSGHSEYCCSISTSVLVVACIVSGLVLIALITAIIICCYKNYKDKQTSRVRRLRQQEDMNAPRVPGVEPPKPPSYVSAPPAYSEQMPESHFRPASVTGNIPYNQRFRGTTPGPRGPRQSNVSFTNASGRHPNNHSFRTAQIPGAVEVEAPPPTPNTPVDKPLLIDVGDLYGRQFQRVLRKLMNKILKIITTKTIRIFSLKLRKCLKHQHVLSSHVHRQRILEYSLLEQKQHVQ